MVQRLGLHSATAGDPGLLPGQETKILQAVQCGAKKKKQKTIMDVSWALCSSLVFL